MRLLSKYVIKELVFPFAVALGLITFLLTMNKILTLVDLVLKHGVGIGAVAQLVLYILPPTFSVTLPMSLLVAVLVALGRLSADAELTAIKAGAVSLSRLFRPLLWVGLAFSLATFAFNETTLPRAIERYQTLFFEIVSKRSSVMIQENTWVSDFRGMILHVGSKDPGSNLLKDLTVIKLPEDKEPMKWIQARQGQLVSDKDSFRVYLQLQDGTAQFLNAASHTELTTVNFAGSTVDLDIDGSMDQSKGRNREPNEMTVLEMWETRDAMAPGDPRRAHFGVEMHKRIAMPFACLAFVLIAFPLGILVRKGGRLVGFALALGLIFIYYLFLSAGQTYGDEGRMAPWLAMWLANLTLMALGLPMAWAALSEKRFWPGSSR